MPTTKETDEDIKVHTEPDGTVVTTTTTTVTETRPDGTKSIHTQIKVQKKIPAGHSDHPGGGPPGIPNDILKAMKNADRVTNTTDKKFIDENLAQHNKLRANHDTPPLVIDEDLNKVAQAWANKIAKTGKMSHSVYGFGENVFWASGGQVPGARAVDAWYSEIKDFNWNKVDNTPGTGHFTQVIWKDTQRLGVAMAKGKNGFYVVCEYDPPGNFLGLYPQNVLKPIKLTVDSHKSGKKSVHKKSYIKG